MYREKARCDEEHHGWSFSLVFAASYKQVEAFKALLALTTKDSSIREAVIPVEKLPHATFERWKCLNYRPWLCCNTALLHIVLHLGNEAMIDAVLSRGVVPSKADTLGFTPLHLAAAGGDINAVKRLLSLGADLDVWSENHFQDRSLDDHPEMTPFHLAVREDRISVVEFLLDSGKITRESPDFYDGQSLVLFGSMSTRCMHRLPKLGLDDTTLLVALFYAVCYGNEPHAEALLNAGAQVDFATLAAALQKYKESMIGLLLDNKPDLTILDRHGRSLLYYIRSQSAAETLLDEEPSLVNIGQSADYINFIRDNPDLDEDLFLIWFLIERGFEVDSSTVMWAAKNDFDSVFKVMLESQKTLNGLTKKERDEILLQPIRWQCDEDRLSCVKYLIQLECDVNATTDWGATLLHQIFEDDVVRDESEYAPW